MSRVYLKLCSKEFEIPSRSNSEPKSRFSKCYDKNLDVIMLVTAVLFATFAVLSAYGCIPIQNPMFAAGCFAGGAMIAFTGGIMSALHSRGCIIVKHEDNSEQSASI